MLKKLRALAVIAGLCVSACYDFDFPLDPSPQVPTDARLPGTWRCLSMQPDTEEPAATLRIEPRSERIARWTLVTPSVDGTEDQGEFDAYRSDLGGGDLLNALEVGGKEQRKWSFVRYTLLLPDVLRVQLMDDEPFAKVKDNAVNLRRAVELRINDPEIYKDLFVCVRVKPASQSSRSPTR